MALLLLMATVASAHDFEVGGIYYIITNSTTKEVAVTYKGNSYSEYSNEYTGSVVIPESVVYNGISYSVTSIKDNVFRSCKGLTSVVIPNSVTSIGTYAFNGCTSLKELYIEDGASLLSLSYNYHTSAGTGKGLFYDCPLETLYLGRNLSYNNSSDPHDYDSKFGYSPFYGKSTLTSVTIGDCVTSLELYLFAGCSRLESIEIPNSITNIGKSVFEGCSGFTSIEIPNSVTSIGQWAFQNCSALKEVRISDLSAWCNIKFADASANPLHQAKKIYLNDILITKLIIPDNITNIREYTFNECTSITDIEIPNNVASISRDAFAGCINIEKVKFDCANVTALFSNRPSIKEIIIGKNVVCIEDRAFSNCSGIESIIVENGNTIYDSRNNCNAIIKTETNALFYGCKNTLIPENVVVIESYAFEGCSGLTEISIPDNVTDIESNAFSGCTGLASIAIPGNVINLMSGIFEGCSALTSITIPKSVKSISGTALSGCTGITNIVVERGNPIYDSRDNCNAIIETATNRIVRGCKTTIIPNSVTSIGHDAFSGCSSLTEISIPDNITNIERFAFSGCTGLRNVTIPNSITAIGYGVFQNCSGLVGVVIPNSVTNIEDWAFGGCSNLENIKIPNSVTSIGYCAFRGCESLKNIEIPNSVKSIGGSTFTDCTGLTNITIPNSVKSIGDWSFSGCSNLTSIIIGDGVERIGEYAFYQSNNLRNVTIGSGIKHIASEAFYLCGVTDLTMYAMQAPTLGDNVFFDDESYYKPTKVNLTIPEGANYINADWLRYCNIPNVRNEDIFYIDNYGNALAYSKEEIGLTWIPYDVKRLYIDGNITSINADACSLRDSLEEVYINSAVKSIGDRAFEYCGNLDKVVLSESLTSIGDNAFRECGNLKKIFLPKSLNSIGDYAFNGTQIEYFVIPQFVTSIGNYAFTNSDNGTIVVFKSFVAPYIGDIDYRLNVCIPVGANSYPSSKFSDIYYYESQQECCIRYNYAVDGIEMFVFGNADNISSSSCINNYYVSDTEKIVLTPDATGYNLITILPNIKEVDVLTYKMEDRNLYTIEGANAIFKYYEEEPDETILVAGCAITVIPEGTTKIYENAFNSCYGLKSIKIPNSVKNIGYNAFYDCTSLSEVHTDNLSAWCDVEFNYALETNPLYYAGNLYLNGKLVTDLIIPNDVTDIHDCAFCGATGFATIEIPGNVKGIGYSSFKDCSNIKNVKIHDGVNSIGSHAFEGCSGITEIKMPSSVTRLGNYIFQNCTGLKKATINNNISYKEFVGCTSLATLEIGKETALIDSYAFDGCTSLANIAIDEANSVYDKRENSNAIIETASNKLIYLCRNSSIPSTVTAIGGNSMNAYTDLDITVPAFVTSIDDKAFNGVNRTHFESEIPASISGNIFGWGAIYVPDGAYEKYCSANVWSDYKDRIVTSEIADKYVECYSKEGRSGVLDAIGLNEVDKVVKLKVKGEINSYDITVFRDKMPLLSQLDLSEATVVASSKPFYQTYCTGNNSLGGYAFYDLDKLASVKLPKGLKILGENAFKECNKLMSVDASATDELNIGKNTFDGCNKLKEFVSPAKISEVGEYAFYKCDKLESIELRDISGSIGSYAFAECGKLITGDIESVGGNIKEYAFKESNIEEVRIGAMSGNVEDKAFGYCPALKNIEFGKGPEKIGSRAFEYTDNLETITAGNGALEIADNAFKAFEKRKVLIYSFWGASWETQEFEIPRTNLKKVVLPNSVEKIGKGAFKECIALSDFTLPQDLKTIGENAFSGCSSLKSVNIPGGVTEISQYAFEGCDSLEKVNISNGVETIGNSAFYGCKSLNEVNIANSVTTIGTSAYANCSSLKNVTFPSSLKTISNDAFTNCGFENLKLPPAIRTIGGNAFYGCNNLTELHIPSSVEYIGSYAFRYCSQLNDIYTYTVEPTTITETTFSTFATARLHVPETSYWNYYWNIGWSRFDHKKFVDFNEVYEYFYLNNDYYLDNSTGYIEGTPDADMRPGSGLIVEGDENNEDIKQNLGDVSLESDGEGNSASIIGDNSLYIENLNVKINIKGGRWYFFAFPWDVKVDRISMQNGSDYVFRYYDGEERAKKGNGGWKNVNEPHLKASRGYIFQSSGDDVLVISIENVKFKKEDKYNELIAHTSENLNDASWNLMGNPYLSYYDLADMEYTAPVTVWDGEKYVAIRPGDDDYQFAPCEAFFVQKPEGEESVTFAADGQMTKTQAETDMQQNAAARRVRGIDPLRLLVNLVLADDVTEDRTRVVFNERQTHNYETACDAAKFETAGVPQLYTIDDEGVHYAINERPKGNGVVLIGYTAPTPGYYTIDAPRMDTQVFLYDAETEEIHYFEDGAYRFSSEAGTFEKRFSLGIRADETTGIEELKIENGNVKGENGNVKTIYDLHGRKLNRTGKGVYIIGGEKVVK